MGSQKKVCCALTYDINYEYITPTLLKNCIHNNEQIQKMKLLNLLCVCVCNTMTKLHWPTFYLHFFPWLRYWYFWHWWGGHRYNSCTNRCACDPRVTRLGNYTLSVFCKCKCIILVIDVIVGGDVHAYDSTNKQTMLGFTWNSNHANLI